MKQSLFNNKRNLGVFYILASTILFGSYGVWSRLIGDSFGNFYQGWTRAVIISLILIPILIRKKQFVRFKRKDWKWLIVFLAFTSGTQAPIFYAFNNMDIGTATLLFFTTMLLTMYVVGFAFLRERLSRVKVISFFIALFGLYSIFSFSLEKFTFLAAAMAVLNGIASGGEVSFSKKLTGNYSPLYLTALSWLIIIPTNGILSVAIGEPQVVPSIDIVWLWQIGYTIASLFAFLFVITGLKYLEASIGGLLGLLEVIFSIAFGIIVFGEQLTSRVLTGTLLILFAASLPHIEDLLKTKPKQI